MLAMQVGGDPKDLPCDILTRYEAQIVEIENFKAGEKYSDRRARRMEQILQGQMTSDEPLNIQVSEIPEGNFSSCAMPRKAAAAKAVSHV